MLEILPEAEEKEEFPGFSFPLNLQSLANAANGLYLVGHKLPRKFRTINYRERCEVNLGINR